MVTAIFTMDSRELNDPFSDDWRSPRVNVSSAEDVAKLLRDRYQFAADDPVPLAVGVIVMAGGHVQFRVDPGGDYQNCAFFGTSESGVVYWIPELRERP